MNKFFIIPLAAFLIFSGTDSSRNKVVYLQQPEDPVLKELEAEREAIISKEREETEKILQAQKRDQEPVLYSDLSGVVPPGSLSEFKTVFHHQPQAQYATNTCWSFAATSFYESEIYRLSGKKIKLSEMWTVYWEYIEKVTEFIRTRGRTFIGEGSESNAVNRVWKKYGVVPLEAFSGKLTPSGRYDHTFLFQEVEKYLQYISNNNIWDETLVHDQLKAILAKHIGVPPESFVYQGQQFTPLSFLQFTGLQLDDYCEVMSTLRFPFYEFHEFTVPDNWWHSKDYLNLPLNEWYNTIKSAIKRGYSVCIGGDVSEPGKLGKHDLCFIPTFDIPAAYINQESREFRISNGTTTDDHGVHLVGYAQKKGFDWFLIKDSGRSARWGRFEGYYFFREDFVRLKMLTFTVHKDILKEILKRVNQ